MDRLLQHWPVGLLRCPAGRCVGWSAAALAAGWLISPWFHLLAPVASVDYPLRWAKAQTLEKLAPTSYMIVDINSRICDQLALSTGELFQNHANLPN